MTEGEIVESMPDTVGKPDAVVRETRPAWKPPGWFLPPRVVEISGIRQNNAEDQ